MPYHPRSISQSPSQRDCFTSPLADAHGFRTHLEAEQVMGLFWLVAFAGTCWHCSLSNLSIALATLCRNSAIPFPEFWAPAIAKKNKKNVWQPVMSLCYVKRMLHKCFKRATQCHHHRNVILFSWPHKTLAGPVLSGYLLGWLKYGSLARRCFMLFQSATVCSFEAVWTHGNRTTMDNQTTKNPGYPGSISSHSDSGWNLYTWYSYFHM